MRQAKQGLGMSGRMSEAQLCFFRHSIGEHYTQGIASIHTFRAAAGYMPCQIDRASGLSLMPDKSGLIRPVQRPSRAVSLQINRGPWRHRMKMGRFEAKSSESDTSGSLPHTLTRALRPFVIVTNCMQDAVCLLSLARRAMSGTSHATKASALDKEVLCGRGMVARIWCE